jgi:hypothetical protein
MSSVTGAPKIGDRVVISVSAVHGTVKGITGTGDGTDNFTNIINIVIDGDDQVEYMLPVTAVVPEPTAL